jgi:hypothetical protein
MVRLAAVGVVGAEEQPGEFGAARSEESGESDDLALLDLQVEGRDAADAAEAVRLEQQLPHVGVELLVVQLLQLVQGLADHQLDEADLVEVADHVLADQGAVAQDGHPVADLVDLVEEVRHEEDRDALVLQPPHQGEEFEDLVAVEAGGRLVEDEHLGARPLAVGVSGAHRPYDRDQLLHGQRVRGQGRGDVDVEAEPVDQLGGLPAQPLPLDAAEAGGFASDEDVLRHRQVGAEVDLLVDRADAGLLRLRRAGEPYGRAVQGDGAAVQGVDPGQHLDEGGLAGAVLAEQCVDLAGEEPEVDTRQSPYPRKLFDYARHLQDGQRLCHGSAPHGFRSGPQGAPWRSSFGGPVIRSARRGPPWPRCGAAGRRLPGR